LLGGAAPNLYCGIYYICFIVDLMTSITVASDAPAEVNYDFSYVK